MEYAIIQPPFSLQFREKKKRELEAYREWFNGVIPGRIIELTKAVKGTKGFENWVADGTPDSLGPLGEWFSRHAETRQKTREEIEEINSRLTFPIDIPGDELTNMTLSLAMDIGMYFGHVILNNLPHMRWDQDLKDKRFADYGQPVIIGNGKVPLNPVRIAVMLAYSFAAKEQPGTRLRALYDTWVKMLSK